MSLSGIMMNKCSLSAVKNQSNVLCDAVPVFSTRLVARVENCLSGVIACFL